jgi:hypothetical protein
MRFVVALYSVRRIGLASSELSAAAMREKERETRGESSLSTCRAWRAEDARRVVGRGRSMMLGWKVSRVKARSFVSKRDYESLWEYIQRARKLGVNSSSHSEVFSCQQRMK